MLDGLYGEPHSRWPRSKNDRSPRASHRVARRRSPARPDVTAQAFLNGRAYRPARTSKVRKRGPSGSGEVRLVRYDPRCQRTPWTAEPAHGLHLKTANSREPTRNRRRSLASGRGPERGNGIPGPKACRPLHDRIRACVEIAIKRQRRHVVGADSWRLFQPDTMLHGADAKD